MRGGGNRPAGSGHAPAAAIETWSEVGGTWQWLGSEPLGRSAHCCWSGCSGRVAQPGHPAGSRAQVIGFSQANGSDEWRTNQNRKVAENCNPVAQTLVSDALGDDAKQSDHVDEFISRPVNVLLLTPNTAAGLTEAAKRALDEEASRSSRSTGASTSRSPSTSARTTS